MLRSLVSLYETSLEFTIDRTRTYVGVLQKICPTLKAYGILHIKQADADILVLKLILHYCYLMFCTININKNILPVFVKINPDFDY